MNHFITSLVYYYMYYALVCGLWCSLSNGGTSYRYQDLYSQNVKMYNSTLECKKENVKYYIQRRLQSR